MKKKEADKLALENPTAADVAGTVV